MVLRADVEKNMHPQTLRNVPSRSQTSLESETPATPRLVALDFRVFRLHDIHDLAVLKGGLLNGSFGVEGERKSGDQNATRQEYARALPQRGAEIGGQDVVREHVRTAWNVSA